MPQLRHNILDQLATKDSELALELQINAGRRYRLIDEGKIDEAKQSFASVKNIQESIQLFIQLANSVANKGDKKTAMQILQEANALIIERPKNSAEMNAKLNLATAYTELDPERGFEITASLLPQLNDLISAAIMLNGFENNYLRDDEWLINNSGDNIANSINQCQQQVVSLASIDFDRAVALAESFQRDELRLKTRLLIAKRY